MIDENLLPITGYARLQPVSSSVAGSREHIELRRIEANSQGGRMALSRT